MKKNNLAKKIIALSYFVLIFACLFLFLANQVLAQSQCELQFPGDGKCETTCTGGRGEDTDTTLCTGTDEKCCHQYAAEPGVPLQVPIFDYTIAKNLPDYIVTLYTYALYAMVPIAIVIIMIAGVRWIIAGGDMGKIKEAKKYISGAVIGLVIAILGSFVLNLVGISDLSLQRLNYIVVQEWDLPDVEIPHVPQNVGGTGSNPPAQPPGGTPPPGGGSVGGKCFPVATGGLGGRGVSWNWGSRRGTAQKIQMPDGSIKNIKVFKRCHAGIDIYTGGNAYVVAIADGKVVNKYNFKACGGTYAVIVNHGSFVVNYGELNLDATYVANGQQVRAGQILGVATTCGMLHFELYNSGTTKNLHWMPGVELPNVSNICRQQYLSSKPAALRDPTETIKALKSNMCSGFR